MKIVRRIKAERALQKLRDASALDAAELDALRKQVIGVGPVAIEPTISCLAQPEARAAACDILGALLNDATVDQFIPALSSPNAAVRDGVTEVLSQNRRYNPAPLLSLLADAKVPKSALSTILLERAAAIPLSHIRKALSNLGKEGRVIAFRLLERRADAAIAKDLVALFDHEDWSVRAESAKLLSQFSTPEVVRGLVRLLSDPNRMVRADAVRGLHGLRQHPTIPPLCNALRDPDLKVQSAAIDALVDFGDASAVPHLLQVLTDDSEHARRGAVEVLNAVATPAAIQDLLRALHDADWWVRVRAADALGSLGGDKVVEAVIGALDDEEEFIRRYAVEILNTLPSARAVEPLIHALKDPDWWVRERSIDALAGTADARAVEPLLALMLRDESVVPLCVKALGAIGDPRAVEPLCRLIDSKREDVRREVKDALIALDQGHLPQEQHAMVQSALSCVFGASEVGTASSSGARRPSDPEGDLGMRPSTRGIARARDHKPPVADAPHVRRAPAPANLPTAPAADAPRAQQPVARAGPGTSRGGPASHASEGRASAPAPRGIEAPEQFGSVNFAKLREGTLILDRYRVLRKIGVGGFAAVYLVEDSAIEDQVILKILNPQFSADDNAIQRFVQELKLTRRVTDRYVIRIYDFVDLGGTHAVSMEYFRSNDLGRILANERRLPAQRLVRIALQVCEGLTAAHDAGVIHRDIKPANILVGENDDVKIVDFGLAWAQQHVGSRLTRSGLLIGTPEYMAPELIRGESVDSRADLYALGIVMFECLSGRPPFMSETPVQILFQHLEAEPPSLAALAPHLPTSLVQLVERVMARDRNLRPASARELYDLLDSEMTVLGGGECR